MICHACGGDGGYERAYGYSRQTGELTTDWVRCTHCDGTGALDLDEIDIPDLDELLDEDAAMAASEG